MIAHNKRIDLVRLLKDVATFKMDGTPAGIVKITLPVSWADAMLGMTIKGYNYTQFGAWELKLGGYPFSSVQAWQATNALLITSGTLIPFTSVRFAFDGQKCCILIGTTSTLWNRTHMTISDVNVSHTGINNISADNWKIELITDETGITVTSAPTLMQTLTAPATGTQWHDLVLLDGFEAYSDSLRPQYCKMGNLVGLRGMVKHSSGTTPKLATITVLPSVLRPARNAPITINGSSGGYGRMDVSTAGTTYLTVISDQASFNAGFTIDGSYVI